MLVVFIETPDMTYVPEWVFVVFIGTPDMTYELGIEALYNSIERKTV